MDQLRAVAEQAVLAPSSHNSQPWIIGLDGDTLSLRPDRSRALPVADPEGRELVISCGAALLNARIAAAHLIGDVDCQPFPDPGDPELLARLRPGDGTPGSADDDALFLAIPVRRTYRRPFADRSASPALVTELEQSAHSEGARLTVLAPAERDQVSALVAEGDELQWQDPAWREELAGWLRPRRRGDGLMVPAAAAPLARLLVSKLDMGRRAARRDRRLAEDAPVLAVLETSGDTPASWLAAGQALELLLLRAASAGLQASFLNQPVQVPELRSRLRTALGLAGHPQLILRIGYPDKGVPAGPPRRPAVP